jgi:transcriptional regulator with XRE-family HTH domain
MYEKPTSTFAKRLREAIDERDVSMAEVARQTNISTAAISRYLRGDYEPKQDKMYALAKYLMVNPAWLMGFAVAKTVAKDFFPINNITLKEKPSPSNEASYETLYNEIRSIANKLLPPEDMKLMYRIRFLTPANKAVVMAMVETLIEQQNVSSEDGGSKLEHTKSRDSLISHGSSEVR